MGLFSFKKKEFFTEPEKARLIQAIRQAERLTSGEIRLYIESRCAYVDPLDRAKEVFGPMGMANTRLQNGVLLYVALLDKQFAILGDSGIHQKVGQEFWQAAAGKLKEHFSRGQVVEGLEACILEIGQSLRLHFPHLAEDENELPDDIVFGK
ncbi:TLP18.3, Psb32 and MOLO-1 founding protein of phosphatase [Chitinophaga costaii]|uniref:TLP18.3, Psb32 and MOLO-1 founding protein of phosphatase n=1 Tax=Chitinophaga costaii TaxID=1335309 RepID=A0A1C4F0Y2_9BACT|nr:TPM domain-containing protein [Chitinophaga costaii]PUZ22167.1 hypothetical protein DCM91_15740 [Chitinophaga costaii]SCC49550.1 TLP18.3, Psb32 and MOLO-1 founding protein of phosphatase [Chitinophaga costaii]